jgi:hypothetical protein
MAVGERDKMVRAMLQEVLHSASSSRQVNFCNLGMDRCHSFGT